MKAALVREIVRDVRFHLDEEIDNESLVLADAGIEGADDSDIDSVVRNHIAEALDYIHKVSPVEMLDGLRAEKDADYTLTVTDGVVPDIRALTPMLRVVSFRAFDTPFNVREVFAEGSAQGHMQLKPYTRGTWDRPALIMQADSADWLPHLKYYTLKGEPDGPDVVDEFLYVPKQFAPSLTEADDPEEYWLVCSQLYESVVNYTTGLVLNTYGEHDRAQIWFTRAETK